MLIGVTGIAVLSATLVRRVKRSAQAILGVGVALTVAGAFFPAYIAVGSATTNF